jgi:D-alanine-D-alanine ligase-like ATP-grasp enzyme
MKIKIISSKGHWRNGWLTTPQELQRAVDILTQAGVEVTSVEVSNVTQLEYELDNVDSQTMIWSNAYYVNNGTEKAVWLNDYVQARNLPLVGSSAQTLRNVMQKNDCQQILGKANLPIPAHAVLTRANLDEISTILEQSEVEFPMVLKPTAEAGSVGVTLVKTMEEAVAKTQQILAEFPLSQVIAENFLPSEDITCGFLRLGDQVMLLATKYLVKSVPSKDNIMSRKERLQEWDEHDKVQPHVTEPEILTQLQRYIPQIIEVLKVEDISRIDGRLDATGQLRFFDVNGLPALDFPESAMNNQCFNCFPDYSKEEVSKALIHTIVYNALLRYGMDVPQAFKDLNMFTMESNRVMKVNQADLMVS